LCEDLPENTNRVELSTELFDSSGIPAPKITYRLAENSVAMIDWQVARAMESLQAAGAWHVESQCRIPNGHFMGTARMGDGPSSSVVDRWCMAHDVPNLGIIDGSVFVTAGCANPTSTIAALALRAAEHLIETRDDIPVPQHASKVVGYQAASNKGKNPDAMTPVDIAKPVTIAAPLRARFERLADTLIPASDGLPGAGDVDIGGQLLDRVLRARPDLADPLQAILVNALDDAHTTIDALATNDRVGLHTLRYVVAGAYYLDTHVRSRLGYPGTVPAPVRALEYPEYLAEGLLDHLVSTAD
jgi:hypothetical protein